MSVSSSGVCLFSSYLIDIPSSVMSTDVTGALRHGQTFKSWLSDSWRRALLTIQFASNELPEEARASLLACARQRGKTIRTSVDQGPNGPGLPATSRRARASQMAAALQAPLTWHQLQKKVMVKRVSV